MVLESLQSVLLLLFLPCRCQTAEILPPQNVSALWNSDFEPGLSWLPPHHSTQNCSYEVSFISHSPQRLITKESSCYAGNYEVMEGGFIQWSISTVCKENRSVAVVLNVSYPDIVNNLTCYLFKPNQSRCEWLPIIYPPDLKFFYDLVNECRNDSSSARLVECPSYIYNNSMKTGCEIQATACHTIYVLFNGTLNNKPVKNTFRRMFKDDVRPPPLTFTATKHENKIKMSWIEPDIVPKGWTFRINYVECNVVRELIISKGETSLLLDSVSHCQYKLSIRAERQGGETPWSEWKHFDAEHDSNMDLYTLAIILIVFGVLAAFTCVCCQKNRGLLFPKVPKPTDFLTDIMDNKFASDMNFLAKEEEDCIITLVTDLPKLEEEC